MTLCKHRVVWWQILWRESYVLLDTWNISQHFLQMQALQECAQCKRSQRKLAATVYNHQNISHTYIIVQACFSEGLEFWIWLSNNTRKCKISQSSEISILFWTKHHRFWVDDWGRRIANAVPSHTSLKRHLRLNVLRVQSLKIPSKKTQGWVDWGTSWLGMGKDAVCEG